MYTDLWKIKLQGQGCCVSWANWKIQSLKPSSAQGLSTLHVSHVQKRVLKLVNFKDQKVQKPDLFDLADTFPWLRDGHWLYDMPQTMGPIFQQRISKRTAVAGTGTGIVYWETEFIKFLMKRLRCDQGTIPVAGAAPGQWVSPWSNILPGLYSNRFLIEKIKKGRFLYIFIY